MSSPTFEAKFRQGIPSPGTALIQVLPTSYQGNVIVKSSNLPAGITSLDSTIPSFSSYVAVILNYNGSTAIGDYNFTVSLYETGAIEPYQILDSTLHIQA